MSVGTPSPLRSETAIARTVLAWTRGRIGPGTSGPLPCVQSASLATKRTPDDPAFRTDEQVRVLAEVRDVAGGGGRRAVGEAEWSADVGPVVAVTAGTTGPTLCSPSRRSARASPDPKIMRRASGASRLGRYNPTAFVATGAPVVVTHLLL